MTMLFMISAANHPSVLQWERWQWDGFATSLTLSVGPFNINCLSDKSSRWAIHGWLSTCVAERRLDGSTCNIFCTKSWNHKHLFISFSCIKLLNFNISTLLRLPFQNFTAGNIFSHVADILFQLFTFMCLGTKNKCWQWYYTCEINFQ